MARSEGLTNTCNHEKSYNHALEKVYNHEVKNPNNHGHDFSYTHGVGFHLSGMVDFRFSDAGWCTPPHPAGHTSGLNRYRIATEHGLQYETVHKDFESREHALNWIISNQLGRRNLNPNQIAYLRGKRYETEKKLRGGDGTNQFTKEQMGQCDPIPIRTSQKLADEYGVAERTIRREGNFSKVVDILPEPKKEEVLSGKDNFGRNETSKILKMDKPTQKKFLKEKNGITFLTIWLPNFRLRNRTMLFYFNLNFSPTIGAFDGSGFIRAYK